MTDFSNPQAYERWMGRWSARLAPLFVRFAGLESPGRYLDVGAGTGVLARAIADEFGDAEVVGIEPAASYVDYARARLRDPRFRFELGDAQAIPFDDDSFDAALALLLLHDSINGAGVSVNVNDSVYLRLCAGTHCCRISGYANPVQTNAATAASARRGI